MYRNIFQGISEQGAAENIWT